MSSLTIDEKMHVIERMRSQSSESVPLYAVSSCEADNAQDVFTDGFHSLKYRIFVCLFAFSVFFAMYKMNFEVKGHKITELNVLLEEDVLPEKLQTSLESVFMEMVEASRVPSAE